MTTTTQVLKVNSPLERKMAEQSRAWQTMPIRYPSLLRLSQQAASTKVRPDELWGGGHLCQGGVQQPELPKKHIITEWSQEAGLLAHQSCTVTCTEDRYVVTWSSSRNLSLLSRGHPRPTRAAPNKDHLHVCSLCCLSFWESESAG